MKCSWVVRSSDGPFFILCWRAVLPRVCYSLVSDEPDVGDIKIIDTR